MRYIYIPIDNRPCNNLFPAQQARLQGIELVMPPASIMDDFTTPSNHAALTQWIAEQVADTQETILVLAVDNLVYGSILESRRSTVTIEQAATRMEWVADLKKNHSCLRIYAFNVLMRTSISVLSTAAIEVWALVNEYSQLLHKIELWHKSSDKARKSELESAISAEVLDTFLMSRKRNHMVNRMGIEFVHDGIFENLSILQEDSTEFGVHKLEQADLMALINQYNLGDKVHIHDGTDEAGSLTVAKAIAEVQSMKPQLGFVYLNDNRASFMASYEDRLFHENLLSHAATVGIELQDNTKPTDVLVLYTPVDKQFEASLGDGTPPCDYTADQLDQFGKRVADLVARGKRVYFLDVAYANGGQGEILRAIHRYTDVTQLYGYSAWNTASNALGTILAQIVLCQNADTAQNARFTMERLLDDFAYQGVVRKRLQYALQALGEDTLHLKDKPEADRRLAALMEQFVSEEPIFCGKTITLSCELPWPRIFEARVLVETK